VCGTPEHALQTRLLRVTRVGRSRTSHFGPLWGGGGPASRTAKNPEATIQKLGLLEMPKIDFKYWDSCEPFPRFQIFPIRNSLLANFTFHLFKYSSAHARRAATRAAPPVPPSAPLHTAQPRTTARSPVPHPYREPHAHSLIGYCSYFQIWTRHALVGGTLKLLR
jgi:hypothetical protein